jgi:hypothetical protein
VAGGSQTFLCCRASPSTLKRQLLTADLAQDLGAIEVSRSVTDHLADMRRRSAPHLRSSFWRISAASNCRFKVQSTKSIPATFLSINTAQLLCGISGGMTSNFGFAESLLVVPHKFHMTLAWVWILGGFISGMLLGLKFHRENWLGGYASHRRRLYRLGHISFFGLGAMNLFFAFTLQQLNKQSSALAGTSLVASVAFAIGTITMPLCCALAAHKADARTLFAIPVTSLMAGGACTLWEVIAS